MNQEEYRACMAKGLKGRKLGKEERKLEFCILSKLCSQKSKDREEAKAICVESASNPKPPTMRRAPRRKGAQIDYPALASCLAGTLKLSALTTENVHEQLNTAMAQCTATTAARGEKIDTHPITYKRFMKTCMKEELGGVEKPFIKSQREIDICKKKWRAFKDAAEEAGIVAPQPIRYHPEGMVGFDAYKSVGRASEGISDGEEG